MIVSKTLQTVFSRFQPEITDELCHTLYEANEAARRSGVQLDPFYGQFQYQLGWVDAHFSPGANNTGKLLRPTLLLLAFEAVGADGHSMGEPAGTRHLRRALPAAAAIELTHNFSLIHDDIEDGDDERRHRPTVWKIWGIPQAINTGSGMFSLARLALWKVLEAGVDTVTIARLSTLFDQACLRMIEGQYLDISFEDRLNISVSMYLDMIERKTAALMGCAAEMGALLGTDDQKMIDGFRRFGQALGIAFQVRDDILGVWASSQELGKTPAGDLYRRKKSLPVLHALHHANISDQERLRAIYQQKESLTEEQVEQVLAIFTRTQAQEYCYSFLTQQCKQVQEALAEIPRCLTSLSNTAFEDMSTIVHFLENSIFDLPPI